MESKSRQRTAGIFSSLKGPNESLSDHKRKIQIQENNDDGGAKKFKKMEGGELEGSSAGPVNRELLTHKLLEKTFIPRIVILILWVLTVAYASYETFLAAEEHIPWQRDPVMNPGPFTRWIRRGRDVTDFEWSIFSELFFSKAVFWYAVYLVLGQVVQMHSPRNLPSISAIFSFMFLTSLVGLNPTIYLFCQPVVYWLLIRCRSKSLLWVVTFLYVCIVENKFFKEYVVVAHGLPEYYFAITCAWNAARCISFSFDTWDRRESTSLSSLASYVQYCFYFPLTINGPLILFDKYEKHILQESSVPKTKEKLLSDTLTLAQKLGRLFMWALVIEIILHYLYFRPLALTIPVLYEVNWWALCGVVFWLGQFFQLKYVVMYGIPSAMSEFEGLSAPPLPRCISHIHRYSVLWKDFDRGLYYFLVRYTYLPTLTSLDKWDSKNRTSLEFRKCLASLASFTYVYIWHNASYEVFIWALFNFLGITLERVGSFVKRRIDAHYNILPAVWDVALEPIFTIPLAIMSVINSAVFTGTLATAYVVTTRFFAEFGTHYVPHFLFLFTHVGVLVRTWPTLQTILKRKLIELKTSE